ncbi:MAG: serine hydrolase domain-containing protein [Phycisphaerales bacterium JB054]
MHKATPLLVVMFLLLGCTSRSGVRAPLSGATTAAIGQIGQAAIDEDGIVGLSIAIAVDGRPVYQAGFGHADTDRTVPVTAHTVFDIASTGKHFTAAAILLLAEQGRLTLDQRAREFVPELPAHFPDATIDQLLRHTSGFVGGPLDEQDPPADYQHARFGLDLLTDVELQRGQTLFEPDETWVYCNPGYLVLGLIVEAVSGERYDDFVRRHLLAGLGPHNIHVCEYPPAHLASQRIRRTPGGVAQVAYIDMSAWGGQGSINASAADLIRWSIALNSARIISSDSLLTFRRPTTVRGHHDAAIIPYGTAQRLGSLEGHTKVGHTGTFDGGSAALAYYPDDRLEIAVLSNTRGEGTPHAHQIETKLAKLLLDIQDPDVRSLTVPLTDAQRHAIRGTYTDGRDFIATLEGDELVVFYDGEEAERLVHVGDMRFRKPDRPDQFEWFLPDGDRAGWWVYSLSGNFLEVLRRKDPSDHAAP